MNFEYKKVFTIKDFQNINSDRIKKIEATALKERNYLHLNGRFQSKTKKIFIENKLAGEKYINERIYGFYFKEFPIEELALLSATASFPDDKKFADVLLDIGYDLNKLEAISKVFAYLKIKKICHKMSKKDFEIERKFLSHIKFIASKIKYYYYGFPPETILNKINSLLAFNKDLLITPVNGNAKVKTRSKTLDERNNKNGK